jgi:hypothetical protein
MIAPFGTGGGADVLSAERLAFSHSTISGEYQITTGACVPL